MNRRNQAMVTIKEENLMELVPLLGRDAAAMQAVARGLHRWNERACNEQLTARQERRVRHLEAVARTLAHQHSLNLYVQTDPRGWPIYLSVDQLTERDYDRGVAVYPGR